MENFTSTKTISRLLAIDGTLLFIPYNILGTIFDYPAILRQDIGIILTNFIRVVQSLSEFDLWLVYYAGHLLYPYWSIIMCMATKP